MDYPEIVTSPLSQPSLPNISWSLSKKTGYAAIHILGQPDMVAPEQGTVEFLMVALRIRDLPSVIGNVVQPPDFHKTGANPSPLYLSHCWQST